MDKIELEEIQDKNISFLIGSGASHGLFPTLELKITSANGQKETIETLATKFSNDKQKKTALFAHYYKTCIKPVLEKDFTNLQGVERVVVENYKKLLSTLIKIIQVSVKQKTCNLFTTNYDGCIEYAANQLLSESYNDFVVNDGTRGFFDKYLHVKNFNCLIQQTGIFERSYVTLPQINLAHVHGSIYWKSQEDKILVNYSREPSTVDEDILEETKEFSACLEDDTKTLNDLPDVALSGQCIQSFWREYNKIPIVNPTKFKFKQTVLEENYYQLLRHLSYELECPNSVLVTFGFSFADEHIYNIVRRSLSNPSLKVFVCCFDNSELQIMKGKFQESPNVELVFLEDEELDFTAFNEQVLTRS